MHNFFETSLKTIQKIRENELSQVANDMTYKLVLSFFPLLMFLLTLLGFFNIDFHIVTNNFAGIIPVEIVGIIEVFWSEIIEVKRPKLLSISLAITIFSSTSGFRNLVSGLKKAYGENETRNILKIYLHSFFIVGIFAISVVLSSVSVIFGSKILHIVSRYLPINDITITIYNIIAICISIFIMFFSVILINKISLEKNITIKENMPGALFTVIFWLLSSFAFNIYIRNFSDMAKVYGSVAGIMIFFVWINIICNVILIGATINGIKIEEKNKNNIELVKMK
ncbi:MAG: YihY/virulence factor BrkB family protein [Defluviitaleaceae bacterium]|nr:YihY/virulence factor BrkB family protein [Defluviitaleaceae bacterium]